LTGAVPGGARPRARPAPETGRNDLARAAARRRRAPGGYPTLLAAVAPLPPARELGDRPLPLAPPRAAGARRPGRGGVPAPPRPGIRRGGLARVDRAPGRGERAVPRSPARGGRAAPARRAQLPGGRPARPGRVVADRDRGGCPPGAPDRWALFR